MAAEDKEGEILDMMLILRDVACEFKCYSANDMALYIVQGQATIHLNGCVKKLIASKMKAVRELKALKHLYELEEAIANLRSSFSVAKATEAKATEAKATAKAHPTED